MAYFPQHFLYFFPLPQMQGSLRPIFGEVRITGCAGAQQLELLQQDSAFGLLEFVKMNTTN
ncbi:hypothetical protein [Pseudoalteromonas luteoviolacea]|uniref:Uncharacterized protein n=1 Tax=Pseudoalteromonas luteoviolacea S4054 TaxID=1129367 RepID=A0A0F6AAS1_9GAMM|nr:hypothetical protein [Pseudoalteromonas luteoviolacea]KZN72710.1 hypothetical protein N481_00920 [Pseudoalteromonas luteoviolacea S4047-1]AOT08780.1 hypothetical protein S4054249_13360 [Pseudoalteromonas luteoviolacea]AOT13694.1 hypothetical protein S40542_13330 [Pseudoalteromonas luteoviolacea]AOT18608.1 hypothetical protein S4054_13335 [Pseudoalteromonas luteoviolacea]KKE82926.1 hypothetical protein N479_16070 [Pseudoalteromonas luteoviolacea S4054]